MGIMDKARETADQARKLATQAVPGPPEGAEGETQPAGGFEHFKGQAKIAAKLGKSSLDTIVEKIDPGLLADLIIKATAAQEKANLALREKHSPYRIAEITMTATIPPQIGFTVSRIEDMDMVGAEELHSSELIEAAAADAASVMPLEGEPDATPG